MSATVWEMVDSMSGSITQEVGQSVTKEVKRRYVIGQCDDFNTVESEIAPYTPRYIPGPYFWWVRKKLDINGIGNKYFDCTATYSSVFPSAGEGLPEGEPPEYTPGAVSWDTTGNTEHITQANWTLSYGGNDLPDFQDAINVSGDAVQGLDVVRPGMRYSETWIIPVDKAMNDSYVRSVCELTGTVNKSPFRAWDEGEVLFMGARGQWPDDSGFVTVTFEFEARLNESPYYIRGITDNDPFDKKGWEYVWILYEDEVSSNTLIKRPRAAFLCEVYKRKSWASLGIGSGSICSPQSPSNPNPGEAGGGGFE